MTILFKSSSYRLYNSIYKFPGNHKSKCDSSDIKNRKEYKHSTKENQSEETGGKKNR